MYNLGHRRQRYPGLLRKEIIKIRRQRRRSELITLLGAKCAICGFNDYRALQLDHIEGGGNRELKELGHTERVYRRALMNPQGYQLLCANCNTIKEYEKRIGKINNDREEGAA